MIEKTVYQAEDGRVFDTKKECLKHEMESKLWSDVADYMSLLESDDKFDTITYDTVVDYILENIDEINQIINSNKEMSTQEGESDPGFVWLLNRL